MNMEQKLATLVLILSLFMTLVLLSWPTMCQEVEDESEFNYDEESERGPVDWGDIKPEWSLCKNGTMQSPIDLWNESVQIVSDFGPLNLKLNYHPSNATLKNRGHDIKLEFVAGSSSSYLQINGTGTQYLLKQFHWHSPSEHTINATRFDLELHMVHETPLGQIAVIGVLYKIGKPDHFLSLLRNEIERISESGGEELAVGVIDPRQVQINTRQYYRYIGSLTTPPCSQNVTWTIITQVKSVSRDQIKLLRDAVHDESESNARPLQPINNRLVQLNKPKEEQVPTKP